MNSIFEEDKEQEQAKTGEIDIGNFCLTATIAQLLHVEEAEADKYAVKFIHR